MNYKNLLKLNWLSSFKKAGIVSLMLSLCFSVMAQQATVSGTINDENGAPLPGVTVVVKGTTIGAATDINGRYTVQGVSPQSVLVFSFVGFVTQEVIVGDMRNIDITLLEDSQQIEEVVVVGYGTRRAGEVTGAVSVVRSEEIQRIPAVTAAEVLRNVPGVTIFQANTPGAEPEVRVRGIGTINNASPLWVVDGIPCARVNPEDIETITVLKDAAAQAIYGTRAANGVILVTTKQGKRNERVRVNINARFGVQNNVNYYDMLNTKEYAEMLWLEQENDWRFLNKAGSVVYKDHPLYGNGPKPDIPYYIYPNGAKKDDPRANPSLYSHIGKDGAMYQITEANQKGTDWLREISRPAKYQDINMNVTGGGATTTYAFTLGYQNNEGSLYHTGYNRFNMRANVQTNVNDWFSTGAQVFGTYSEQFGLMTQNAESSAISWCYRMQPIIPMFDIMNNYAGAIVGAELGNGQNPMNMLVNNKDNLRERTQLNATTHITLKPIKGLTLKSMFSWTNNQFNNRSFGLPDDTWSERTATITSYMTSNYSKQWTWTNTADYTFKIDKHDVSVMVASEAIENTYYEVSANRQGYWKIDPDFMDLAAGTGAQVNGSNRWANALFSVFGRLNYTYDGKYMVEGVVRRDGSSRFAKDERYGIFPAVSLGWMVSKEAFMVGTRTWLDVLKLRGGYGTTGNDRMDNYNSYSTYDSSTDSGNGSYYALSGSNTGTVLGFRQARLGNTNVKWETTSTLNFGIDATIHRSLSLSFDLWQRTTSDMLYQQAVPQVFGRATVPYLNVGEMTNKGFDIDINYRGTALKKELKYNLGLNVSRYVNKITKLSDNPDEFLEGPGLREMVYTRSQVGTAFPEFFGYKVDGIFQTEAEAAAHPEAFSPQYNRAGRYKYRDISGSDGKPDNRVNSDDRTYIGSPHPKFTTGLNFNFEYKGFDLNGQLYASVGHNMVNYVRRFIDFSQFYGGRSKDRLYKSWGSPYLSDNSKAKLPAAARELDTNNQFPSTAWIEDASYLRLRNLQFGYDLNRLVNLSTVSSLRVYLQVTNLFTITKYSGLNPEQSPTGGFGDGNGPRNFGIDQGQWPTPRQWMFGISVGL